MYDFDTLPDRLKDGSAKWDDMLRQKPDVSKGVAPLTVADMEFMSAPEITGGLADALQGMVLGYHSPRESYYDAVTGWMKARFGWDVDREWIVESSGIVTALFALVDALTQPGEGVIVMRPVYGPFMSAVEKTGRRLTDNPLAIENGRYVIDFDDLLRKAADPSNTMMIFCSPHNPVGRVWTRDELAETARICRDNGVLLVSDEIHQDIVLPGYRHITMGTVAKEMDCPCIVCTSPSKTFNIAGMQISNVIIPDGGHRDALYSLLARRGEHGCGMLSYKAAELAYTKGGPWLEEMIAKIEQNRREVEHFFAEHFPALAVTRLEGTYLMWVDCRPLGLSEDDLHAKLHEAEVFLTRGSAFGEAGRGFVRINIACPTDVLIRTLERMRSTFAM